MSSGGDRLTGAVCFTDLVGFTEFTDVRGDEAAVGVLDHQRRLVDAILHVHPGVRLVKELGDGLMLWCPDAEVAVGCALAFAAHVAAEHDAGSFPLGVRVGIHHGQVTCRGHDLVGQTVNIAARIADLAGPSEMLVSDEVLAGCNGATFGAVEAIGPIPVRGVADPIWLNRVAQPAAVH